jgi:predicted lipoprotein with Yx(FWY)xxD motif
MLKTLLLISLSLTSILSLHLRQETWDMNLPMEYNETRYMDLPMEYYNETLYMDLPMEYYNETEFRNLPLYNETEIIITVLPLPLEFSDSLSESPLVSSHRMMNMTRSRNFLNIYHSDLYGDHLVDSRNMSLYMFEKDHVGFGYTMNDFNVTCYDQCEINWPPLLQRDMNFEFEAHGALDKSLIGSVMRRDGTLQVTYNNIPLYHYFRDLMPGDTKGQALWADGGFWYLIDPTGLPIKTTTV